MKYWSKILWKGLYPLIAPALIGILRVFGSKKIKEWLHLRAHNEGEDEIELKDQTYVLFFCPSLGEYESIAHVIRQLKEPGTFVEVAFVSPSGYNGVNRNKSLADRISYAPIDTKKSVNRFLSKRNIDLVVFSTLAIWPNFLLGLKKHGIPYCFTAVTCKDNFKKRLYYRILSSFLHEAEFIMTIGQRSKGILGESGISSIHSGDPRIDSITFDLINPLYSIVPLLDLLRHRKVVLLGSTHQEDEKILLPIIPDLLSKNYIVLIAPHEVKRAQILKNQISSSIYLDDIDQEGIQKVIIVNSVGILKHLYSIANVSYIGGSQTGKVHNVIEPVIAESIICFGPDHQNSSFAKSWAKHFPISIIRSDEDFIRFLEWSEDEQNQLAIKRISKSEIDLISGGTEKTFDEIKKIL